MSNEEQTSRDRETGWVMPEPVFRTSEGHTPKSVKGPAVSDEVDTLETETAPDTGPRPNAGGEPAVFTTAEMTPAETTRSGGCFRSFLFILTMIALFAAVIAGAVIYFLTTLRAPETGNF